MELSTPSAPPSPQETFSPMVAAGSNVIYRQPPLQPVAMAVTGVPTIRAPPGAMGPPTVAAPASSSTPVPMAVDHGVSDHADAAAVV